MSARRDEAIADIVILSLSLWASAEDALELANRIATTAGEAIARRRGTR